MASSRRTITRSTADASSAVTVSSQKGIVDSAKVAKPGNRLTDLTDPSDQEDAPECSICLQPCIHAVQLPCTHVFCFLCVKGIANQSKKCALCRQEIPPDFIYKPLLLRKEELEKEVAFDGGYQWFYEGNRGWWQYDERASSEIEERFKKEEKVFEMLIAGFLYVIDMENMIQYRRNDPTRRRKIKRDLTSIPDKKGVAGLQCVNKAPLRKDGDGGIEDRGTAQAAPPQPSGSPSHAGSAPQTAHPPPPIPPRSCHVPHLPSADSSQVTSGATENEDSSVTRSPNSTQGNHTPTQSVNSTTDSPEQSDLSQPHNTPQTPESVSEGEEGAEGGSEGEDELEHDSGKEESAVTSEMSNLCLGNSSGHGHHRGQLHIPSRSSRQRHETKAHSNRIRFIQSPSSSDSEWD